MCTQISWSQRWSCWPSNSHLNLITDKLSRLQHVIQSEWSIHQEVFSHICVQWHTLWVNLFATRFKNKLSTFVSPVPDHKAWKVDAFSLPSARSGCLCIPTRSIRGKLVKKLINQGCRRMILITPSWPNMPWFCDLRREFFD